MRRPIKPKNSPLSALVRELDAPPDQASLPRRRVSGQADRQRKEAADRKHQRKIDAEVRSNERQARERLKQSRKRRRRAREQRRYEQLGAEIGADPIGTARDMVALSRHMPPDSPSEFAEIVTSGCLAAVCECLRLPLHDVLRQIVRVRASPGDPEWLLAVRARRIAAYVANAEIGIKKAAIARAFTLTEAAICIACRDVEEQRDDPRIEALIQRATAMITASDAETASPSQLSHLDDSVRATLG